MCSGRQTRKTIIGIGLSCLVCPMLWGQAAPDTIYYNGSIITVSDGPPRAQAVAIRGDRFTAVGTDAEVLKSAGPQTRKIDLAGKCVVPGIIESHVHPISAALSEIDGPVPLLHSITELLRYVHDQDAKLPAGRMVFVPKVYSTRLTDRRYPNRYELDESAPRREAMPLREVMLDNGYASVLNS